MQVISTAAEGCTAGQALQSRQPAGEVDQAVMDLCLNLAQHIYRLYHLLTMEHGSGRHLRWRYLPL